MKNRVKLASLVVLILAATLTGALAKIDKVAVPSSQGLQLYWWPELPILTGWQHDEGASREYAANVVVPEGYTFSNAPAVMYGKALYKSRMPGTKSVAELISNDRAEFEGDAPGVRIKELPDMRDGDGKYLKCFSFSPLASGPWESVAYSEEGDFFLIFTVSAETSRALQAATPAFSSLVSHYKANP